MVGHGDGTRWVVNRELLEIDKFVSQTRIVLQVNHIFIHPRVKKSEHATDRGSRNRVPKFFFEISIFANLLKS